MYMYMYMYTYMYYIVLIYSIACITVLFRQQRALMLKLSAPNVYIACMQQLVTQFL